MADLLPWREKIKTVPEFEISSIPLNIPVIEAGEWSLPEWLHDRHKSLSLQRVFSLLKGEAGCVVVRGFPIEGRPEADIHVDLEQLTGLLGIPSRHGATGPVVWRVTPRRNLAHVPTFSEAASEAPLHTDNSWERRPEDYFALLAVRPAVLGGETLVLTASELIREFARVPGGEAALALLAKPIFPFASPEVFLEGAKRPACEVGAVITPLANGRMGLRYRYDVIRSGFELHPELATEASQNAIAWLEAFLLRKIEKITPVKLAAGDLLLAHNYTVLHARTDFNDPDRLLLRVRITRRSEP